MLRRRCGSGSPWWLIDTVPRWPVHSSRPSWWLTVVFRTHWRCRRTASGSPTGSCRSDGLAITRSANSGSPPPTGPGRRDKSTSGGAHDSAPRWAADSLLVYFLSDRVERGSSGWEGTGPHRHDRLSPISYASTVCTPVPILHGENDTNVPVSQTEFFHRALRRFGVEHKYVVYPRENHSIRERNHQLDVLRRTRAWFDRWLG